MNTIGFVAPYGEELQLQKSTDGTIFVGSATQVLLKLNQKASDVAQAERIVANLRQLPVSDSSVDLTTGVNRFRDTLSDKLALAKQELNQLDVAKKDLAEQEKKEAAVKRIDALKKKLGIE